MFNRRSPVLVSAPAVEPVLLSDVKLFLKIDGNEEDSLLSSLMASSRRAVEEYIKAALITQSWKLTMDRFPCEEDFRRDERWSLLERCEQYAIQLPRQPIQSIESIKTTGRDGTQSTVAPETYTLDQSNGRVLLNDGFSWPTDLRDFAAVEIVTLNGYGDDGGEVPEPINQAIVQYTCAMYCDRTCADLPAGCKSLLSPYMSAEAFCAW